MRREKAVWERGEAKGQQTHTGTKGPKGKRGLPASAGELTSSGEQQTGRLLPDGLCTVVMNGL